ncbi:TylF/MycF/NovP-related O-methyltransferase [Bradyrhizobium sp. sGM-13]|uniref:TylF/MycF/NovP-related O-methyltransferase n=1 Tax=Bradyrhizobium sp. sGM-13 TaxID=2831781 RepID=UPI0020BE7949|nr:TylF/MycF/NovP-related O-methyltransferase [Bradyrhizobium sp. sGM-13]
MIPGKSKTVTSTAEEQPSGSSTNPTTYNTALALPHPLPRTRFYQEKIPLLVAFEQCLYKHLAEQAGSGAHHPRPFVAAECGVYKGHSLIACARVAQDLAVPIRFFGLDTFTGLPTLSAIDADLSPPKAAYKSRTLFADASLEEVRERCEAAGLLASIELVKGLFSDTLVTLPELQYDFVNIDCDLYEGHIQCLEYFYGRMKEGGTIFFDDYHSKVFPMARQAIDAFLKDRPETLFHVRWGDDGENQTKAFILKE